MSVIFNKSKKFPTNDLIIDDYRHLVIIFKYDSTIFRSWTLIQMLFLQLKYYNILYYLWY